MAMTGTVQFFINFWQRAGDGGSLVKERNWKITLESQTETLFVKRNKLWRVIHVTNLQEDSTYLYYLSGWYRGNKTFSSLLWDERVFLFGKKAILFI
jgi:hypothetical protein